MQAHAPKQSAHFFFSPARNRETAQHTQPKARLGGVHRLGK